MSLRKKALKKSIVVLVLFIFSTLIGCSLKSDNTYVESRTLGSSGNGIISENVRTISVFKIEGQGNIFRNEEAISNIYEGMRIFQGDKISTGEDSQIYIEIDGNKVVKMEGNTTIEISEIRGNSKDNITNITLTKGKVINGISKLNSGSEYNINTSNSTMGVRGTVFSAEVRDDDTGVQSEAIVYSGVVELTINDELNDVFHSIMTEAMHLSRTDNGGEIYPLVDIDEKSIEDIRKLYNVFNEIIQKDSEIISNEKGYLINEFEEILKKEADDNNSIVETNNSKDEIVENNTEENGGNIQAVPPVSNGENQQQTNGTVGNTNLPDKVENSTNGNVGNSSNNTSGGNESIGSSNNSSGESTNTDNNNSTNSGNVDSSGNANNSNDVNNDSNSSNDSNNNSDSSDNSSNNDNLSSGSGDDSSNNNGNCGNNGGQGNGHGHNKPNRPGHNKPHRPGHNKN